jgi:hypothetical protein
MAGLGRPGEMTSVKGDGKGDGLLYRLDVEIFVVHKSAIRPH